MKVKPSMPDDMVAAPPRTCEVFTIGLPLLSSTKLCGCGLPPKLSRLHLVSCAVIATDDTCEYASRYFCASTWQNSSVLSPVFSRATMLTTFLIVSVETEVELSPWVYARAQWP